MANMISRADAEALLREGLYDEIFQHDIEESIFMRLARRLPDAPSGKNHIRVLDMVPVGYFVNGENGLKGTSAAAWEKAVLNIEEMAVIVPISENTLEDEAVDIFGQVTPLVRQAFGALMDKAAIFGEGRPASWPLGIVQLARQAGNNVTAASPLSYDNLLGVGGLFNKVENANSAVTAGIASMAMRAALRGIKDDNGYPIFKTDMQGATPYALDGAPLYFPRNGGFDSSIAQMVVGDWSQAVYAVRRDIDVKILDQAVIQNPDGTIAYNLAQQDMVALRVTFRIGWTFPNAASPVNPDRVLVPFAYLAAATPQTTYTATFTVLSGGSAAAGAIVNIDGARIKADASGQAVFNLPNGTYAYKATLGKAKLGEGTFTINGAAATVTVGE